MEYTSNTKFKTAWFRVSSVLFIGLILMYFIKPKGLIIGIVIYFLVQIYFLAKRFTEKIVVADNFISFYYVKWLQNKKVEFDLNNVQLLTDRTINRYGKFINLKVLLNGKQVYAVEGQDGFDNEDLSEIASFNKKI